MLDVKVDERPTVTTVRVGGGLDTSEACARLSGEVALAVEHGCADPLIIDLSEVTSFDDAGRRCVVALREQIAPTHHVWLVPSAEQIVRFLGAAAEQADAFPDADADADADL